LLPICPIYLGSWRKSLQNAPLTIRLETRILVPRTFAEKANCLVNGLNCTSGPRRGMLGLDVSTLLALADEVIE
jgi:hypothetical protein